MVAGKRQSIRRIPCRNCKERKVKCSGERPSCRTCANSNRWCRGYEGSPVRIPVVEGSRDASRPSRIVAPEPKEPGRLLQPVSPRHALRQQLLSAYIDDYLPPELCTTASRDRYFLLYVPTLEKLAPCFDAIVWATCAVRIGNRDRNPDMRQMSLQLYQKSIRELQKAIDHPALRSQDQTVATCLGLSLYEFSGGPAQRSYEYQTHYNGTMELLRLRGPVQNGIGLGYTVLRALRHQTVYMGIQTKQPTFLAEKEWIELPWASRSGKEPYDKIVDISLKIPIIFRHDAALGDDGGGGNDHEVSDDDIDDDQDDDSDDDDNEDLQRRLDAAGRCVRSCWRLDARLTAWLKEFEAEWQGSLYWPAPVKVRDEDIASRSSSESPVGLSADALSLELFPMAYDFPDFIVANAMVVFWGSRVTVCHQLTRAYRCLETLVERRSYGNREKMACTCPGGDGDGGNDRKPGTATCLRHFELSQLPPLGYRESWSETFARNICQSVEYFFQPQMGFAGPGVILPPLSILQTLWAEDPDEDRQPELSWIQGIFSRMRNRGIRDFRGNRYEPPHFSGYPISAFKSMDSPAR